MSEGIRFRRESASFNIVLDTSKGTKTDNNYRWQLDLPKNLSVEDFVGKFVQIIMANEAASMIITCVITNAMTLAMPGMPAISSSITATADLPSSLASGADANLTFSYMVNSGKTLVVLSTQTT